MDSNGLPRQKSAHRWIVAVTTLAVLGMGLLLCLLLEKTRLSEGKANALEVSGRTARQLHQHLSQDLATTYALAALVKQGRGEVRNFDGIAAELLSLYPGVSALQLAPGGIIRRIVPLAGNEKAIGHNLLADEKRNKEARLAMQTGKLTLAGPFELIQGGEAVIGRLPVFMDGESGGFWGFTTALIRMADFLKSTQIEDLEHQGYSYELWRVHPDTGKKHVFARSRAAMTGDPVTAFLDVPNGRWQLSLAPAAGWLDGERLAAQMLIAALLAAAAGWSVSGYLRTQRALVESSMRYRALYEATPSMMHSINAAGEIVSVSQLWLDTLGYARNEVIGRKSSEFLTEESRRYAVETVLPEFFRTGNCKDVSYQMVTKAGDVLDVLLSAVGERGPAGKVTRSLAVIQDVTARKRAEDSLRQAMLAADAANRAKSAFLAAMSHEIRTPMNGILGMAQLLLLPELTEEERNEYARTILNSGQTLLTLLNDILDLSKVEAGKLELARAAFDPRQVVEETGTLFAELVHAKGLTLEVAWHGPARQRYWADPIRLRQMLSNLISNAIKFTAQGFVRLEACEIKRNEKEALLEFAVADSGIGIPPDKQALLFKPFSQVDDSTTRAYGGTGLGLSIIRSLATLMAGEVGVASEAGKGSRFWFRIRADLLLEGQDSRQGERGAATGQANDMAPGLAGCVLVVEDNPTNRAVIEALLKKLGIAAESMKNGAEAVDAIANGLRPDLVLMDVQMPVMDGFRATELIRRRENETRQPHLPIIALTASAYEEDRQNCMAAGMDDFLAKPVDMNDLASVLAKWMGRKAVEEKAGT
ncbi:MAG: hypothetical protein A2045_09215 [Rhodocyclales bacterium GWA2_65_20]|nr:MAG: hypothetical protein A2045_09215 [Rhodocyclales bacterium GWA2_65_20]